MTSVWVKLKYVFIDIQMTKAMSPVQESYDAKSFLTIVKKSY